MPKKATYEDVVKFLEENDVNNECTLLSTTYVNNTTPLSFKCNLCDRNFERDFAHLKRKRFKCSACAQAKKVIANKFTYEDVVDYIEKNDINNECTLLSTEYINSTTPLKLHCNICGNDFTRDFTHIKRGRFRCEKCGERAGATKLKYSKDKVMKMIYDKDKYTLIGEYTNGHTGCLCKCSKNHEFTLYFSEWLYSGRGCPQCATLRNSGEQHWNWNGGGHQGTLDTLRHAIIPWKKISLKNSDYKCDISGLYSDDLVIHHATKNFRALVDEACKNTGIPLLNKIVDYSIEDRQNLEKELLKLHENCKGIVMRKVYHDEFHSIYGKTNNTLEQYLEFKKIKQEKLFCNCRCNNGCCM